MPADAAEIVRLAERVEQATGPDRELDAEIAVAVLGGHIAWRQSVGTMESYPVREFASSAHVAGHGRDPVPAYTASLDAAMTLVPEGWSVLNAWNPTGRCKCDLSDGPMDGQERRWIGALTCVTPALALTAAALRARAAMEQDHA